MLRKPKSRAVFIYWDYDSSPIPYNEDGGAAIVARVHDLKSIAGSYGKIAHFNAYVSERSVVTQSGLGMLEGLLATCKVKLHCINGVVDGKTMLEATAWSSVSYNPPDITILVVSGAVPAMPAHRNFTTELGSQVITISSLYEKLTASPTGITHTSAAPRTGRITLEETDWSNLRPESPRPSWSTPLELKRRAGSLDIEGEAVVPLENKFAKGDAPVFVYWDYDNSAIPKEERMRDGGAAIIKRVKSFIASFGRIAYMGAYITVTQDKGYALPKGLKLGLEVAGVQVCCVRRNGVDDAVDHAIMVDIAYCISINPQLRTVVLITGDRDFSTVVSKVLSRGLDVVLIPGMPRGSQSVKTKHTYSLPVGSDIFDAGTVAPDDIQSPREYEGESGLYSSASRHKPEYTVKLEREDRSNVPYGGLAQPVPYHEPVSRPSLSSWKPVYDEEGHLVEYIDTNRMPQKRRRTSY